MYPCVWAPKLEACRNSMWFGEMIRDSYNLVFGVHGAVSAPLIFQHQMELFDWNGRCFFWFGKSGLVKSLGVSNVCNSHCNLEINLIVQDNLYTIFLQILQLVTYKPLQPLKQASSIYWYMHATCHGWYMREREKKKKMKTEVVLQNIVSRRKEMKGERRVFCYIVAWLAKRYKGEKDSRSHCSEEEQQNLLC